MIKASWLVACLALAWGGEAGVAPAWRITLQKKNVAHVSVRGESQTVRCETTGPNAERFVYESLKDETRSYPVKVVLDVAKTSDGWSVKGSVINGSDWRVTGFEGPRFDGIPVEPTAMGLYVPDGFGKRVASFPKVGEKKPAAGWGVDDAEHFSYFTKYYPGREMVMPWVALDDGKAGVYVGVHDPAARVKRFRFRYDPAKRMCGIASCHPLFLEPGQTWMMPETVLKHYTGTWHVAAKTYRTWYDTVRRVGEFPKWTKEVNGWLLVILKQQNEEIFWPYGDFDKLADYADKTGLNTIGLFGWTVGGHDHLYPDYDPCPKMGGRDALVKGIQLLKRRGKRVCIYANGQLQQVGATTFWDEHGRSIALVKNDGQMVIQNYHKYKDIPRYDFALGCLHAPAWGERMLALAKQAESFGADGILFDQLGIFAPFACFGEGHGHPAPGWSYEAERPAFIARIADEMKKINPAFAVFTEGLHDSILDSIACFHGCQFGTFHTGAAQMRTRFTVPNAGGNWPEIAHYTFPEIVSTVRIPTPIVDRGMANYTVLYGYRHDIELRYGPDRVYVETGKVTTDYGKVVSPPSVALLRTAPQSVMTAYMKAIGAFQEKNADLLLAGRFVDTDGFALTAQQCLAARYVGAKGESGVLVWNVGEKSATVKIDGLGAATSVTEPEAGAVDAASPLAPDTLRLYRFAK